MSAGGCKALVMKCLTGRGGHSDNQLYRQAGNSVTIQVVYAVGRQILAAQEALEQGE